MTEKEEKVEKEDIDDLKMHIIVNNDLDMSAGKIASQVGHIVMLIVDDILSKGYECPTIMEDHITYMKWKKHCTKIIHRATEKEMRDLLSHPDAKHFIDTGNTTEVPDGSLTVIGFPPSNKYNQLMKKYRLLD